MTDPIVKALAEYREYEGGRAVARRDRHRVPAVEARRQSDDAAEAGYDRTAAWWAGYADEIEED